MKVKKKIIIKRPVEMSRMAFERGVVNLQHWIKNKGLKILEIFEGSESAGDNGAIKHLAIRLNPSAVRIIALPVPIDRERS